MFDLIIKNGIIYDGSGNEPFCADVGVKDGYITEIGEINTLDAKEIIDAKGRCVTPGFFDMHSHADLSIVQYPNAENLLGQGVTTAFCGHCGMGMAPVGKYWKSQVDDLFAFEEFMPFSSVSSFPGIGPMCLTEKLRIAYKKYFGIDMDWTTFGDYRRKLASMGIGINLIMEVGFQQIRTQVMGLDYDRPATEYEICQMEALVEDAMDSGAFGVSFGYDYTPDMSASEEELTRLTACVKRYGGIVTAHTRNSKQGNPDWQHIDGIKEFLELGRKTGAHMHISHIMPGFTIIPHDQAKLDDSAYRTLEIVEEYRKAGVTVTWDTPHPEAASFFYYPELCSPLIYYILACGGKTAFRNQLNSDIYRNDLIKRIQKGSHIVFPRIEETAPITKCKNESYVGKTLKALAEESDISVEEQVIHILMEDMDTCIKPKLPHEKRPETDVYWKQSDALIGLDNGSFNYDYEGNKPDLPHFRSTTASYGGMIHFLNRSEGIPFEETIRKLTGNAADTLGLIDRGYLKTGYYADILVIDRENLNTNENFIDPRQKPSGLDYVIVNGQIAVNHKNHTHVRSGQILNRI